MPGRVVSVNTAPTKGERKSPTAEIGVIAGQGVEGDAHFGGEKQVSLLADESIDKARRAGIDLSPGDFGENLTVEGIDLLSIGIGQRLQIGDALLQISEIGKVCATPCSIGRRLGECIMPTEGVFAKVLRGGRIASGDQIEPAAVKVGAILTSSDRCSRGETEDESGPVLVRLLDDLGVALSGYSVVPDDESLLSERLAFLADRCAVDVILTTGGTGFGVRDRMPEATLAVIESPAPGISEALRQEGMRHTPYACLSRGVSGLRSRTLIINLPGSRRAVEEGSALLRTILPHALEVIRAEVSDCGRHKG